MKEHKEVIVNGKKFKIYQFMPTKGLTIKYKLFKIILPTLGALAGEGLKSYKEAKTIKNDLAKMSTAELLQKIDPSLLEKAAIALVNALPDDLGLYHEILSMVHYNNVPISHKIDELFVENTINYSSLDKLVLESLKHQDFLDLTAFAVTNT